MTTLAMKFFITALAMKCSMTTLAMKCFITTLAMKCRKAGERALRYIFTRLAML